MLFQDAHQYQFSLENWSIHLFHFDCNNCFILAGNILPPSAGLIEGNENKQVSDVYYIYTTY